MLISPVFLYSSNIVYSLQIATFNEYNKANLYNIEISKKLKNTFLYKTDNGYWTVRYGQENSRKKIKAIKQSLNLKVLQKSVSVPTSLSKLELKTRPKVETPSITQIQTDKNIESKDSFFTEKIGTLNEEYKKIDTYTFNLKIGSRIYIVQFSDNPYNKMANMIFNLKPKSSDINSVTLSNKMVVFNIKLNNIDKSFEDIEKTILPILNSGRRNKNIRIKAYRLKN